jgi:RNA polymerase sigma-70 factor (ECF subfamily)
VDHGATGPDQIFERRWAQSVLERALVRLRDEYARAGRSDLFDALKDLQPGKHGAQGYAELGATLGLTDGGMKTAVHRLRQRHRQILREEIAHTVAKPEEIDDEIRHLLYVLGA